MIAPTPKDRIFTANAIRDITVSRKVSTADAARIVMACALAVVAACEGEPAAGEAGYRAADAHTGEPAAWR